MPATIKDVARLAGVSIYSVSKYINGGKLKPANQEAVRKAIEELDYKPNALAQSLRTSCSMLVGVVLPSLLNRFYAEIAVNIEKILTEYGYTPILLDCENDPEMLAERFDYLIEKKVDGIICVPLYDEGKMVEKAQETGIPVVAVGNKYRNVPCDAVLGDDRSIIHDAVKYLISLGHTDIAFVGDDERLYNAMERQQGYLDAMIEASIPIYEPFICQNIADPKQGYEQMMTLWTQQRRPTALVCGGYEATLGVVYAINKRRIFVPDELSVIGFDNQAISDFMNPVYNSIEQSVAKMGESAAKLMLLRISKDQTGYPRTVIHQGQINAGESVSRRLVNWRTTERFKLV